MGKVIPGRTSFADSDIVLKKSFTATLAEVNAGKVLITGKPGVLLTVVGFRVVFAGAWAACTDVRISDDTGTPVEIVTIAQAQCGDGVVHSDVTGTNTIGAGFDAELADGKSVQIRKTGSDATTGTSVSGVILYTQNVV